MRCSQNLIAVGFAMTLLAAANGQTVLNHVPAHVVEAVKTRFIKAYSNGGMSGVVRDLRDCYAATSSQRTPSNEMAVVSCLLYDYSAFTLNASMMKAFVAEGVPGAANDPDPGTPMAYLTGSAFGARLDMYAPIPFGDNKADWNSD